ncbi:MAG: radical SAM protein, partial [Sediminibacterium sp.]
MQSPVFLITPPFTQLNTPYPATAYIKGFLNTKGIPSVQADLGIEVTLALFNKAGLTKLFKAIRSKEWELSPNCQRILALESNYINTIEQVILFLQGKLDTIAH